MNRVLSPRLSELLCFSAMVNTTICATVSYRLNLTTFTIIDLLVLCTSVNYWRDPWYGSWSRKFDILASTYALMCHITTEVEYENIRSSSKPCGQCMLYWMSLFVVGFYYVMARLERENSHRESALFHVVCHIFFMVSNVILYYNVALH